MTGEIERIAAGEMVERLRSDATKLGGPLTAAELKGWVTPQRLLDAICAERFIAAADLITRLSSTDTEAMRRMWKVMRQQVNSCGCDGAYDDGCPRCTFERAMEQANALAKGGV